MKPDSLTSQSQQDGPHHPGHMTGLETGHPPNWGQSVFSPEPYAKDVKGAVDAKPEGCKYGAADDQLAHHGQENPEVKRTTQSSDIIQAPGPECA